MLRQLSRFGSSVRHASSSRQNNIIERASLLTEPDQVMFIEDHGNTSYGQFMKRAGQYTTALSETYKVKKGDRVMARVSKTVDTTALYIACLQLGAIYIPVNPVYTEPETDYFLQDSEPTILITCNEEIDNLFKHRVTVVNEDRLSEFTKTLKAATDIEHVENGTYASICYTSGTTGKPKGSINTHGSLSSNGVALAKAWGFTQADKNFHALPFYHTHGMFISLQSTLFSHSALVWREKFDIEDAMAHMHLATVFMGVPTFFSRIAASPLFKPEAFKNIRLFVSGSAPLPIPIIEKWKATTGQTVIERLGMTEAQVITSNPLHGERRVGTVGLPLDGVKVRISSGGEVEIQSPALFAGYWKNPAKTKSEFTEDGWFKTGYLTIGGRSKDMIITGGFNVYPKELEDIIDSLPDVKESAVIAAPHPDFGEAVVAVVVAKNRVDNEAEFSSKIVNHMKKQVANYKVPKRIILLDALPRNSITKIQKNVLRDTYKHLFD